MVILPAAFDFLNTAVEVKLRRQESAASVGTVRSETPHRKPSAPFLLHRQSRWPPGARVNRDRPPFERVRIRRDVVTYGQPARPTNYSFVDYLNRLTYYCRSPFLRVVNDRVYETTALLGRRYTDVCCICPLSGLEVAPYPETGCGSVDNGPVPSRSLLMRIRL